MLALFPMLFLGSCAAVYVCDSERIESGIDCCTTDRRCELLYGSEFPRCVNPGAQTGVCSECARDIDCQRDQRCDIGRDDFGVCVD